MARPYFRVYGFQDRVELWDEKAIRVANRYTVFLSFLVQPVFVFANFIHTVVWRCICYPYIFPHNRGGREINSKCGRFEKICQRKVECNKLQKLQRSFININGICGRNKKKKKEKAYLAKSSLPILIT